MTFPNKNNMSKYDIELMEKLYSMSAPLATEIFFTPLPYEKSVLIRVGFMEKDRSTGDDHPVCAVTMTIEDLIRMHNVMGILMAQLQEQGIITKPEAPKEEEKDDNADVLH